MITEPPYLHKRESLEIIAEVLGVSPDSLHLIRDKEQERIVRQERRQNGDHLGVRFHRLMSGEEEVGTAIDTIYPRNSISVYRDYNLPDDPTIEHEVSKHF